MNPFVSVFAKSFKHYTFLFVALLLAEAGVAQFQTKVLKMKNRSPLFEGFFKTALMSTLVTTGEIVGAEPLVAPATECLDAPANPPLRESAGNEWWVYGEEEHNPFQSLAQPEPPLEPVAEPSSVATELLEKKP